MERYSAQREAIYACVAGGTAHPTAEAVYSAVRRDIPALSLGTVYRNLALLVEQGRLIKIGSGDGAHYDARVEGHSHIICKVCGRVADILTENVSINHSDACGYTVEGYSVTFFGKCAKCQDQDVLP